MAKKFTLPAELPQIKFGVLPDIHKYPVIKNIMLIVHWMHAHWGEGGGGQTETVTLKLNDYVQPSDPTSSITVEGEPVTTTNLELWDKVVEAVKSGKKVLIQDKYLSTNNGDRVNHWVPFTYEVECVHDTKTDADDLLHFTARGQTIMAGEGGCAIPKLSVMKVDDELTVMANAY